MNANNKSVKLGLTFSGGGAKGAYEIGVWKALKEFGYEKNIVAVSGASVGALNAALYASNEFDYALDTWKNISSEQVLMHSKVLENIMTRLSSYTVAEYLVGPYIAGSVLLLQKALDGFSIFSREGLSKLLGKYTDFSNTIPMYVSVFESSADNCRKFKPSYFKLNNLTPEIAKKYILASSAFPIAWKPVNIDGKHYLDGGIADNVPFRPLIEEESCTHIINVFLSHESNLPLISNTVKTLTECDKKYPETKFWNIIPSQTFKSLVETFDFSTEIALELIELGYKDACNVLTRFKKFQESEKIYLEEVNNYASSAANMNSEIEENRVIRVSDTLDYKNILEELGTKIEKQEREMLDLRIDGFIDECEENSKELLALAFDGISVLASTEGRIRSLKDRGLFGRLIGAISGSTNEANTQIQLDQNKAIYCNQALIQKLSERSALTMEAMAAIQNRLSYTMTQINFLHAQNKQTLNYIGVLKLAIEDLATRMFDRISSQDSRLKIVETKQNLQFFRDKIIVRLRNKKPEEKVLSLVSSFYHQTNGCIGDDERAIFINSMYSLKLDEVKLSVKDIVAEVANNPNIIESLAGNRFCLLTDSDAHMFPAVAMIQSSQETSRVEAFKTRFPDLKDQNYDLKINAEQLALELLNSYSMIDKELNLSISQSPIKTNNFYKQTIDDVIESVKKIEIINDYIGNLANLKQRIDDFKIIVPLVGKFSAGKSRLLNLWLGNSVQAEDPSPTTALATEIVYGKQNRAELHYFNGEIVPKQIEELKDLSFDTQNVSFIRIFLDNQRLKNRPDLIVVDMPGFDSIETSHQNAITSYIERGHEFFLMLRPQTNSQFDRTVLSRLKEINLKFKKPFQVIVSKEGIMSSTEEQEKQKSDMTRYLRWSSTKVPFGFVDLHPRNHNTSGFERQLDSVMNRYPEIFANNFKDKLTNQLKNLVKQIRSNIKMSSADIGDIKKSIRSLESDFETSKIEIQNAVKATKSSLTGHCIARVKEAVESHLIGIMPTLVSLAKNKSAFKSTISENVRSSAQHELSKQMKYELEKLQDKLRSIKFPGDFIPNVEISTITVPELSQGWGVGAIAAIVGGLISGPIVMIIAGILGKIIGKDDPEKANQEIQNKIVNSIIPEVCSSVSRSATEHIEKVIASIETMLDKETNKSKVEYKQNLDKLLKQKEAKEATHKEKTDELEAVAKSIEDKIQAIKYI